MQGHHGDAGFVARDLVVGGHQRRFGEEALERRAFLVALHHFGPVGGAGHELAHVLPAVGAVRALGEQARLVVDPADDLLQQLRRRPGGGRLVEAGDERREGAERLAGVGPQLGDPVGEARGVEERPRPALRGGEQHGDAGVTQPALGHPDGAQERFVVGRVGDQPEVGEQVLHLAPFIEAGGTDEAVGHAGPPERLLERARLGVGAIEYRHLLERPVGRRPPPLQLAHDPLSLVPLVGGREHRERLPALPPGAQRLADARGVLGDHAVGGVEDHLGRAVILLQPDQRGVRKIAGEFAHVAHVGPAPPVDRLVVVPHRADVAVRTDQPDQLVLGAVGVLEFVHQHELEALAVVRQPVGMLAEERERVQEQVVEVHRVRGLQRRPQCRVHVGRHLGQPVEGRRGLEAGRVLHPVLGAGDHRLHGARGERLGGMAALVHEAAHQRHAVVLVVDGEPPGEAEPLRLAPEQAGRERVEGPDPEAGRIAPEELRDPVLHLARRLVGEGDGEDPVGGDSMALDQAGDAGGEHAGLPRPGPGEHQQRPMDVLHRLALRGIQGSEPIVGGGGFGHAVRSARGRRTRKVAP